MATAAPTIFGADDLGPGGRFLLERELGRGGGGTVYLAIDQKLGRRVAVKALHPHVARRQEARAHLFCEARIAAALRHPRIVTIYDLEEPLNLVVMEYCSGGALADRIARGPLPPALALRRLAQITTVLETVHRCGVIHRDLNPANLLIRHRTDQEAPLVLSDFGTAHAGVDHREEETRAFGSLVYMAPEQRRGLRPDPRADIYACGVILIEMLLGRPPLRREQALSGADLLEINDLWRDLDEKVSARALVIPLLELCRTLVNPKVGRRPEEAEAVSARAWALADRFQRADLGLDLMQDLRRRAGSGNRSFAVKRWLDRRARRLGLVGVAGRPE
jgi:serine/threonine protein kinase